MGGVWGEEVWEVGLGGGVIFGMWIIKRIKKRIFLVVFIFCIFGGKLFI